MNDMEQQLVTWKTTLQTEVGGLEQQLQGLQVAIKEKREKIVAIDKLIGLTPSEEGDENTVLVEAGDDDSFTPVKAYWKPILEVLMEMGGRSRRQKVIELVGQKMSAILTAADRGRLPNSNLVRWRNRVAWQVSNMRGSGLIKKDSPRGLWEITEAGRKWLGDNS